MYVAIDDGKEYELIGDCYQCDQCDQFTIHKDKLTECGNKNCKSKKKNGGFHTHRNSVLEQPTEQIMMSSKSRNQFNTTQTSLKEDVMGLNNTSDGKYIK